MAKLYHGENLVLGDLAMDSTPTLNSNNTVKSGGVYSAIQNKLDKSGGTLTGDLILSGDPTSNMEAATKKYVDTEAGKRQAKILTASVALPVDNWIDLSQTVSITGITYNNIVIVSPSPSSATDYGTSGVVCTAQDYNSLTFTCLSEPLNEITVQVLII